MGAHYTCTIHVLEVYTDIIALMPKYMFNVIVFLSALHDHMYMLVEGIVIINAHWLTLTTTNIHMYIL